MAKILVVDDDAAIVAGIRAMLDLHGLESEAAWDRETAEARIGESFFPIILADLRMRDDEDGFYLIDAVRRISPRSRVATITGYADAATVERLRERGAMLVLQKPFDEAELMSALGEMLRVVEEAAEQRADDSDLYAATARILRGIACRRYGFSRDDADELVQEAWLLFLEKRESVRAPRAWLSGTVANLCRQAIGKLQQDRERTSELEDVAFVRRDDSALVIHQGLARIDERSRALCTMIGLEQRSYEEVSRAAAIPLGSVGPLYMRAKARLREAIA